MLMEAMINYIPELIGGVLLVVLTFFLTKHNEKTKAKEQLRIQKDRFRNEKETILWKHNSKLKEQELEFSQQQNLLKQQHDLELEKFKVESKDRDMQNVFTGEYDMNKMVNQMEGLEKLLDKTKGLANKQKNHPAFK